MQNCCIFTSDTLYAILRQIAFIFDAGFLYRRNSPIQSKAFITKFIITSRCTHIFFFLFFAKKIIVLTNETIISIDTV